MVFQGNPRTIRSEHLFFSTLLFLATQLSEWSSDFLLSAEKKKKSNVLQIIFKKVVVLLTFVLDVYNLNFIEKECNIYLVFC